MPYRLLTSLAGAALDLASLHPSARLRPRLALDGDAYDRAQVWLHGASVGEIASAAPVIIELAARHSLIVTANTPTGRDAAAALGVRAGLAPLDTPQALRRFLDRVRPAVAVTVENELWPNRSAALARRGVAQVVIGARLSARSAARWRRLGWLIRPMLGRIAALSAQDEASEARLVALGLAREAVLARVNLKLIGPARRPALPPGPLRATTILAASTHEGEEAMILDALDALDRDRRVATPRLIVAPRHPQRFAAVAATLRARGRAPALRSEGADDATPLLLADTMGEMDRWYAAAGICFTGGSLVARGGHTPWEPAAQSCAILHGPEVGNFASDYARLDAEGAAVRVTADSLADDLAALLADPSRQRDMGGRARAILAGSAGDAALLVNRIAKLVNE